MTLTPFTGTLPLFETVRQEAAQGSESEINAEIDAAIGAVRSKRTQGRLIAESDFTATPQSAQT